MSEESDLKNENDKLKEELAKVQEELSDNKQTVTDLTQALATVTVERTKLDMQLKNLKDKHEKTLQKPLDNEELDKLKNQLQESQAENSSLDEKFKTLNKQVSSLQSDLQTAQELCEAKRIENANLKDELTTTKAELESEKELTRKVERKSSSLADEVSRLEKELERETKEKELVTERSSSLADEVSRLEKELEREKKEKELVTKSLSEKILHLEDTLTKKDVTVSQVDSHVIPPVQDVVHSEEKEDEREKEDLKKDEVVKETEDKKEIDEIEEVDKKEDVVENEKDKEMESVENKDLSKTKDDNPPVIAKKSKKRMSIETTPIKKTTPTEETTPIKETTPNKETTPSKETTLTKETKSIKIIPTKETTPIREPIITPNNDNIPPIKTVSDDTKTNDEGEQTFDQIKPLNRLDSSTALQKAHLSSHLQRKRPSRKHVQSMANLSPFPEEMPLLRIEEEDRKRKSDSSLPLIPPRPKPKSDEKPPPSAPKPKPRPQPRKRQSPEHSSSPTTEKTVSTKTPPESPKQPKRPIPAPRTHPKESYDSTDGNSTEEPSSLNKKQKENLSPQPSPKSSPLLPPKPKIENDVTESPKQVRKSFIEPSEPTTQEDLGITVTDSTPTQPPSTAKKPKPVPPKPSTRPKPSSSDETHSSETTESLEDKLEALKKKDPSELTVKEKMMLAQQAMAKQVEYKSKGLPPPIRKRPPLPKSSSVDIRDDHPGDSVTEDIKNNEKQDMESSIKTSKSMEDILTEDRTPKRHPKKLPPGAFNIAIPLGLPSDTRHRSYTVASIISEGIENINPTSNEIHKTQNGIEDSSSNHDSTSEHNTSSNTDVTPIKVPLNDVPIITENTQQVEKIEEDDRSDSISPSTPQLSRKDCGSSDNISADISLDEDMEEDLMRMSGAVSSAQPDVDQVLYWSPEVVGIWLGNIGLGQHAGGFREKSIKGYMLFDLDNAKIKGMGMISSDERNTFRKEVKVLKPYAEKLKKEYEKQAKEEKKRMEQEKKQAKKKKK